MELKSDIAAVMQAIQANAAQATAAPPTNSDSDFVALLNKVKASQAPSPTTPAASQAVARRMGVGQARSQPAGPLPKGDLAAWIAQAEKLVGIDGSFTSGINSMIQHESGGHPNDTNNWDSNAKAGHPSQGLMQTIPDTFRANALPGYDKNILDPVSNIVAGVRYARARYGDQMIKNGGRHDSRGNYIGY